MYGTEKEAEPCSLVVISFCLLLRGECAVRVRWRKVAREKNNTARANKKMKKQYVESICRVIINNQAHTFGL